MRFFLLCLVNQVWIDFPHICCLIFPSPLHTVTPHLQNVKCDWSGYWLVYIFCEFDNFDSLLQFGWNVLQLLGFRWYLCLGSDLDGPALSSARTPDSECCVRLCARACACVRACFACGALARIRALIYLRNQDRDLLELLIFLFQLWILKFKISAAPLNEQAKFTCSIGAEGAPVNVYRDSSED